MALTDAPNTTTLAEGALQPTTVEQDKSRKVVSLLDTLLTAPGTVAPAGTQIQPVIQQVQTGEAMATPGVSGTVAAATPPATTLVVLLIGGLGRRSGLGRSFPPGTCSNGS